MSSRPSRGTARLAAILDSLPDALVLVNANGTVVNANTIALQALESPGTALVGRGLLDLLPQFDSRLIPGSMRRPESSDERGRTKPARMVARRTDGSEFPVEVTSASLADGRTATAGSGPSSYEEQAGRYSGDELLMIVIRDLTGTVDTEAELARSQRQTEMILRAASEGVVGTDTEGQVVLVNPAAAQILGYRAGELGGRELHPLVLHSRADGTEFPYPESPLADTLRSGRKHRVRGQVLWNKRGEQVPVDLTTAPVRDGDLLVGAVMTFTDRRAYDELVTRHAAEVEELTAKHAAEVTELKDGWSEEVSALKEARARDVAELTGRHESTLAEITGRHESTLTELTGRHDEEIAQEKDRYAALAEREKDRFEALSARHEQLLAVLDTSLRGPLEELRSELGTLAADPAGQLWPEANQILHHLTAGYARMTTLVDNVLSYQRLDVGAEQLQRQNAMLDAVVTSAVDGAVDLIGPGRAQFAVHAPPIEAQVDAARLATALAHLIADVAGIDATGNARTGLFNTGYVDSTIVVAAAQRGDVVRIEVRGPYPGGDPVHGPIVAGIVRAHGGVLQTHTVPGMGGSAYILDVPIGEGAGVVPVAVAPVPAIENPAPAQPSSFATPAAGTESGSTDGPATNGHGRRRARRSSTDAFLESEVRQETQAGQPTGRRRGRPAPEEPAPAAPAQGSPFALTAGPSDVSGAPGPAQTPPHGAVVTAAEHAAGTAAASHSLGPVSVSPRGVPVGPAGTGAPALPMPNGIDPGAAQPIGPDGGPAGDRPTGRRARRALAAVSGPASAEAPDSGQSSGQTSSTSPRTEPEQAQALAAGPRVPFALPPAQADQQVARSAPGSGQQPEGPVVSEAPSPAAHGAERAAVQPPMAVPPVPPAVPPAPPAPVPAAPAAQLPQPPLYAPAAPITPTVAAPAPAPEPVDQEPVDQEPVQAAPAPVAPQEQAQAQLSPEQLQAQAQDGGAHRTLSQPLPAEAPGAPHGPRPLNVPEPAQEPGARPVPAPSPAPESDPDGARGRAFSVRTLGAGVPFDERIAGPRPAAAQLPAQAAQQLRQARLARQQGQPAPGTAAPNANGTQGGNGSGRRRKLATPPGPPAETSGAEHPETEAHPQGPQSAASGLSSVPAQTPRSAQPPLAAPPVPPAPPQVPGQGVAPGQGAAQARLSGHEHGRSYAIGAPDAGAEGPEPLDGPNGAVEVAHRPQPQPLDDELPPEPLDNPRRLLVWPAPDAGTQQALSDRGYRPVVVNSREEVDAQIAAFPAALFVDPLTGPITRTALQSLRQAAVTAEVPVLVTAGLGLASRESAYGADPAVLFKALAPRDSEQHPPRVLLIEERPEIAGALTAALERRAMHVTRAATDAEAVAAATQAPPNLVVMDLAQVRRRRAGIVDWLRANGQLNRTPLVVYTAAGIGPAELPGLGSGESVLFLAERSTSEEVQGRIVDLLAKIGTN
ncbi:PAS domain-containing protein [Streptomyces sp. NPDC049954]|uniref:PAS domain-containing sensor histidine kinase n=1 Tax=Streptomyces sp. NPDC049954 TaxID=3155779 RepID=UPI0034475C23